MLTIAELSNQYDWVKPITPEGESTVLIDIGSYCLDLQTSFKNSISTVEEVASAVFGFFDDIDSKRMIESLNEGVLDFGKAENQLILNIFASWLKKQFYDIREFKMFVRSEQVLGTLIELKQIESKVQYLSYAFYISVAVLLVSIFTSPFFSVSLQPTGGIFLNAFVVAIAIGMGYHWNLLIKRYKVLEEQLVR